MPVHPVLLSILWGLCKASVNKLMNTTSSGELHRELRAGADDEDGSTNGRLKTWSATQSVVARSSREPCKHYSRYAPRPSRSCQDINCTAIHSAAPCMAAYFDANLQPEGPGNSPCELIHEAPDASGDHQALCCVVQFGIDPINVMRRTSKLAGLSVPLPLGRRSVTCKDIIQVRTHCKMSWKRSAHAPSVDACSGWEVRQGSQQRMGQKHCETPSFSNRVTHFSSAQVRTSNENNLFSFLYNSITFPLSFVTWWPSWKSWSGKGKMRIPVSDSNPQSVKKTKSPQDFYIIGRLRGAARQKKLDPRDPPEWRFHTFTTVDVPRNGCVFDMFFCILQGHTTVTPKKHEFCTILKNE